MALLLPAEYAKGGAQFAPGIESLLTGVANRMKPQNVLDRTLLEAKLEKWIDPTTGQPFPDTPLAIKQKISTQGVYYNPKKQGVFSIGPTEGFLPVGPGWNQLVWGGPQKQKSQAPGVGSGRMLPSLNKMGPWDLKGMDQFSSDVGTQKPPVPKTKMSLYDPVGALAEAIGSSRYTEGGQPIIDPMMAVGGASPAGPPAPAPDYKNVPPNLLQSLPALQQILQQLLWKQMREQAGPLRNAPQPMAQGGIAGALNELNDLILMDRGGQVPSMGNPPGMDGDIVHTKLSPGEIVLNPTVSQMFPQLNKLNKMFPNPMARGVGFSGGGFVPPYMRTSKKVEKTPLQYKNYAPYNTDKNLVGTGEPFQITYDEYMKSPSKYEYIKVVDYPAFPGAPNQGILLVRSKGPLPIASTSFSSKDVSKDVIADIVKPGPEQPKEDTPIEVPKKVYEEKVKTAASVQRPDTPDLRRIGEGMPNDLDFQKLLQMDPAQAIQMIKQTADRTSTAEYNLASTSPISGSSEVFGNLLNQFTATQGAQKTGLEMPAVPAQTQANISEAELKTQQLDAIRQVLSSPDALKNYGAKQLQVLNLQADKLLAEINEINSRAGYYKGGGAKSNASAMQQLNFFKSSIQQEMSYLQKIMGDKNANPKDVEAARKQFTKDFIKHAALSDPSILSSASGIQMLIQGLGKTTRGGLFQGFQPTTIPALTTEETQQILQELKNDPAVQLAQGALIGGVQNSDPGAVADQSGQQDFINSLVSLLNQK